MTLDDDNPDYFLHDFTPQTEPDPEPDPSSPQPHRTTHPRGCRRILLIATAIILIAATLAIYIRYFTPYVTDSVATGTVANVERRGIFFKTFEAEIITETTLADTTHIYTTQLNLSIPSDSIAHTLQNLQGTPRQIRIYYSRYYGTLPWRGASTAVITSIQPL